MPKYVSRVFVMRNGSSFQHFKNFRKAEVPYGSQVDLMDGVGTVDIAKRHQYSIDYVIPVVGAKLDWSDVVDEIWIIQMRDGGSKVIYTGVTCITEGEAYFDAQNETVMTLTFVADDRTIEDA